MNPALLLLFFLVATLACTEGNAIRRETVSLSLSKACKRCFDKLNMTSSATFVCLCAYCCMLDCTGNTLLIVTVYPKAAETAVLFYDLFYMLQCTICPLPGKLI